MNETAESTSSSPSDPFAGILMSLGVQGYDPSVVVALEEHSRRVAKRVLFDAKDYSNHANRKEIIEADVLLALKLRDRRKIEKQVKLRQAQLEMNAVDLPSIPDNHLDISYPGPSVLMKRTYTLCSTEEAYPEVIEPDSSHTIDRSNELNSNSSKNPSVSKPKIPIVLNSTRMGRADDAAKNAMV